VSIGDGMILFAEPNFASACSPQLSSFFMCGAMAHTGNSITVVPLPDKWSHSRLDIDGDNRVSSLDAVLVINYLNEHGAGPSATAPALPKHDVNDDGFFRPGCGADYQFPELFPGGSAAKQLSFMRAKGSAYPFDE
jgi:hypothetical protein